MAFADLVTDGVVLECEQSVQHLDAEPPIIAESGPGCTILVAWYEAVLFAYFVQDQLTVRMTASQTGCDSLARAIYLRTIPPKLWGVQVSRVSRTPFWAASFNLLPSSVDISVARTELVRGVKSVVWLSLEKLHLTCWPLVASLEWYVVGFITLLWSAWCVPTEELTLHLHD